MQQQIFIHLEKHYLPYVENRLSVIHPEHVIILAYFQMLHEETGNALSKYEDCTEKTKQNPEETKSE